MGSELSARAKRAMPFDSSQPSDTRWKQYIIMTYTKKERIVPGEDVIHPQLQEHIVALRKITFKKTTCAQPRGKKQHCMYSKLHHAINAYGWNCVATPFRLSNDVLRLIQGEIQIANSITATRYRPPWQRCQEQFHYFANERTGRFFNMNVEKSFNFIKNSWKSWHFLNVKCYEL